MSGWPSVLSYFASNNMTVIYQSLYTTPTACDDHVELLHYICHNVHYFQLISLFISLSSLTVQPTMVNHLMKNQFKILKTTFDTFDLSQYDLYKPSKAFSFWIFTFLKIKKCISWKFCLFSSIFNFLINKTKL